MPGYILTGTAQRDLRVIRNYLATAPKEIRERIIAGLLETFRQAAQFPFSGQVEPELEGRDSSPRSLLEYPYRIFYDPDTSPTAIFAVINGKLDPIRVLKARG